MALSSLFRRTVVTAAVVASSVASTLPTFAQEVSTKEKAVPSKAEGRSFRYGVCGAPRPGPNFGAVLAALEELNVDIVRRDFEWNRIQPEADRWVWDQDDQVVDALHARGIDVQAVVGYTARWASTGNKNSKNWLDWARAAPRVDAYVNFAKTLTEHYRNRVKYIEIWNEPDISFWTGTTEQYTEMFNAASAAVKKVDPAVEVLNGGFAFNMRPPNVNFIRDFTSAADQSNWTIWAYHDYHTFAQLLSRGAENRSFHKAAGAKQPIWINEGGFHTLNAGGEPEQAATLTKKYATAPSLGISAYLWYNLVDVGNDPHETEHNFGLLRYDLSRKPAFYAYREVIRRLAPRRFSQRLQFQSPLNDVWALEYKSPDGSGENVLVLWREGKDLHTPLWIGGDESGEVVSAADLVGKDLPAVTLGKGKLVNVTHDPIYIHFKGDKPLVVKPILTLPDKVPLQSGEKTPLQVTLFNPSESPSNLSLSFKSTDDRVRFDPATRSVELPANGQTKIDLAATMGSGQQQGGKITVTLKAADGSTMDAQIPFEPSLSIPALANAKTTGIPAGQGLVIDLKERASIVNLFDAEPNPEMHWKGVEDLSAKATWAYTREALLVQIDAQDETHTNDNTGTNLWKGDSLQFALRVSETHASYLELALALRGKDQPLSWVYSVPPAANLAVGQLDTEQVSFHVNRTGTVTRYTLRLPWSVLGLTEPPVSGMRMNFLVNDDDGKGRKQWVQLTSGIGREKSPSLFRLFSCK